MGKKAVVHFSDGSTPHLVNNDFGQGLQKFHNNKNKNLKIET